MLRFSSRCTGPFTPVDQSQIEALMDLDYSEQSRVKLMTYHQTKSREADTAIHVYRRQDFFGREGEPFEEASNITTTVGMVG